MIYDFSFPDIFTVFYGIAQSFFSFQNAMGFFCCDWDWKYWISCNMAMSRPNGTVINYL